MTKMTYVNAINEAINGNMTEEVVERLEALKASLAKRNAHKATGMTKTQKANEEIKMKMVETMKEIGEAKTAGEIGSLFGISNQKASALLNQLVKAETVVKTTVKGKSLFAVA